jgi:predicted secreted protein
MQGPYGELNGTDVLVQIEDPLVSGTYLTVASQRGATFTETTAAIDTSSKQRREFTGIPGRYNASLSLEHLYIPSASGYGVLKTAMRQGTFVRLRRQELGSPADQCLAIITSLGEAAPDQDVVTVTSEFQLTGPFEAIS